MTEALEAAKRLYPFRDLKYLYSGKRKPEAVQMHVDDFLGIMETLSITSNKKLMKSMERGLRDIKKKKLRTHKEVFG